MQKVEVLWDAVTSDYKILKFLSGNVAKVQEIKTKKIFAIKFVRDLLTDFKNVMRQIQIMAELSKMKNNIFTSKLVRIILPPNEKFMYLFLVMEYNSMSLDTLFAQEVPNFDFKTIKVIFYNLLCCIKYLHSANVIHRNLSPKHILVG